MKLAQEQLIKHNGKYSDVSNGTKTALGQLIEYNKHDVLGMKHLVEFTQGIVGKLA